MWWLLCVALAAPVRPVSLGVEMAAVVGPGAAGGVGTVRVAVNLRPLSLELAVGEGYVAGVQRQVGRIFVGLRRYLWRGSWVRLGFAHAHEVPWERFTDAPAASLAGTHHGILHRSGVEIAGGWAIPVKVRQDATRLAVTVDVAGQIYPDAHRPLGTARIGAGVMVHVGRVRTPPAGEGAEPAGEEPATEPPETGAWSRDVETIR